MKLYVNCILTPLNYYHNYSCKVYFCLFLTFASTHALFIVKCLHCLKLVSIESKLQFNLLFLIMLYINVRHRMVSINCGNMNVYVGDCK